MIQKKKVTANDLEMDVVTGLESGVIALHPEKGQLETVIESAVFQIRPQAAAKGIRISLEQTNASAVFDQKWTVEALYNLLDNAVKYTPTGGSITVKSTQYQLFSTIHVKDSGPGIPKSEQPKVFQRFYRGAEHVQEEGVGIGLYLVRQIAEGHGGYVKLSSQNGEGCIFSLYFPCSKPT